MILRIAIVDDELLYRRILDEKINIWAEKTILQIIWKYLYLKNRRGFSRHI